MFRFGDNNNPADYSGRIRRGGRPIVNTRERFAKLARSLSLHLNAPKFLSKNLGAFFFLCDIFQFRLQVIMYVGEIADAINILVFTGIGYGRTHRLLLFCSHGRVVGLLVGIIYW